MRIRNTLFIFWLLLSPLLAVQQAAADSRLIVITDLGFVPAQITVSAGAEIQLVISNQDDVVRNVVIPACNVKTPFLMKGEMATVTCKVEKKGELPFYSYSPGTNSLQLTGIIKVK